jgi:hypothetical protein
MSDTILVALITAIGGSAFGAIVLAVFSRRKTAAEADMTVGEAWGKFVQTQAAEIADLKRDRDALRGELRATQGELRATQKEVAVLNRQQNEALYWQARVMARNEVVAALLEDRGVPVPVMPTPPVVREPNTRADDERGRT